MKDAAEQILKNGYARVAISKEETDLIVDVKNGYSEFMSRYPSDYSRSLLSLVFPGEDSTDPDQGLLRKDGKNGSDNKYSLHYRPSFPQQAIEHSGFKFSREDFEFFSLNQRLFEVSRNEVLELAKSLDALVSLPLPFFTAMKECYDKPGPYAAPLNRLLDYQSLKAGRRAKVHIDRSCLTRHMGDCGGYLFQSVDSEGEPSRNISPHEGEVLYFPGVKAYIHSQGVIRPVWHGSVAEKGEHRRAIVHFSHVYTPKSIKHAGRAYEQYQQFYGKPA